MRIRHCLVWVALFGCVSSAFAGEGAGIFPPRAAEASKPRPDESCRPVPSGLPEVHLPQFIAPRIRPQDACDQVLKAAAGSRAGASRPDPTFGKGSFWMREGELPRPIASCADDPANPRVSECVVASESRNFPGTWLIALARLDSADGGRLYNEVGPFYGSGGNTAEVTPKQVKGSLESLRCGSAGICYARRESFQLDRVTGALQYTALQASTPQDLPDGSDGRIVFDKLHWHPGASGKLKCRPYQAPGSLASAAQ